MENEEKKDNNSLLIPASIIVAGLLIAFAVFYTKGAPTEDGGNQANLYGSSAADKMRPVDSSDHILGNPNASVKIVEYSDLECPFCKSYHPTLKQIMANYGRDGKVAWVYRHFPLDSIHSKARKEAEASECAADLGGNDAFWEYIDRVFEITPSNNKLDPAELPKIANEIGLDQEKFESCLASGKYAERVEKDYQDAIASGGDGTPYTVLISDNSGSIPFSGALPYGQVEAIVKQALEKSG
ncbi:MAG: Periplasmic thiol:disulfide interchange protein DsbA [Candidatus Giovannonibacteria bacterium GW2011_GWB1_45_9b]|uniref:Thioredoxin domain-containing protein n=3 Tax=Candidatus Giovannoniibacteriota TaxID=1752738 RepID=A0A1F5WDQ8_9BACT|nr:MAG: Periplasmic thiol:disulfide interchange protein DsbA [Candidatus Giovannonibacteria bacterium GW2011_GWB1_45_9b]OGF73727.1 MAG: hypothetical protein A2W57_03870 [Candidatus Giovannonibacteria bacterium RIFCSPHIGHO2_02_43_16]OGF94187.1 MAG: hypothetical protein A2Y47_00875 [Candidatus Giovannonibacteria bacterium RIFCSPLOWO2_12_43_8]